jgi:hypothetical protein
MDPSTVRLARMSLPAINALLDAILVETLELLAQVAKTPSTRKMHSRAASFRRTIDAWTSIPPTEVQRTTMNALVMELRAEAEAAHQTSSKRSGTYPTRRPTARPGDAASMNTALPPALKRETG